MSFILLVGGHRLMRAGIKEALASPGLLIGEAETVEEGIDATRFTGAGIVVLDCDGLDGFICDAIRSLRSNRQVRLIALSELIDKGLNIFSCIRAGASAIVLKQGSMEDLRIAIRRVSEDGTYLSQPARDVIFEEIRTGNMGAEVVPVTHLTAREMQVLQLIALGKTSSQIAIIIGIEIGTVRTYRKRLMDKMDVANVAAMIRVAIQRQWITSGTVDPPLGRSA